MKIYLTKFSTEELLKIVSGCFDRTDFAKRLGFTYFNGKVSKKIAQLVEQHGLDISHFDQSKKVKARRKYPIVKKNCPVCGKEFETQIGNKEERATCSYSCANTFFSYQKHSPEQIRDECL